MFKHVIQCKSPFSFIGFGYRPPDISNQDVKAVALKYDPRKLVARKVNYSVISRLGK